MKEYDLKDVRIEKSVVALGKFQGLHMGHMLLIDKIVEIAKEQNIKSVVLTININYDTVINLPNERFKILEDKTVDANVICDFTPEFAGLAPEEFVKEILIGKLGAKYVVVGNDYRFGCKRLGDVDLLKQMGEKYNFNVIVFDKLKVDDTIVSTTFIRALIKEGKVDIVDKYLGRHYFIAGEVISGKKLGRTIGFPTANIAVDSKKLLPPVGAYSTRVYIDGIMYKSITNVGYNPTVGGNEDILVETHVIDYDGNLYGKHLQILFYDFLRPETKFANIDELKKQLEKDKMVVRHQ